MIAGSQPSEFRALSAEEKDEVARQIAESGARMVFVGLGCPRREVWVYEYGDSISMPLIAVGAAFDFHAGCVRHVPKKMQDLGLEWLFRVSQDPLRLWRRYLLLNPLYLHVLSPTGDTIPSLPTGCGATGGGVATRLTRGFLTHIGTAPHHGLSGDRGCPGAHERRSMRRVAGRPPASRTVRDGSATRVPRNPESVCR